MTTIWMGQIVGLEEKPAAEFWVNAGVYALSEEVLDTIPADRPFDMPDIFNHYLKHHRAVGSYKITECLSDIGNVIDLNRAQERSV